MEMLFQSLTTFFACLALTSARDTGKFMKTVPTISNSLVNLGKMEIAFYFNGKHPGTPQKHDHSAELFPLRPATEQACPCTSFKSSSPSFLSDPIEMINKILKSNDLFKDPTSSMCCGSHEHMQENTVFFELGPHNIPNFNAPRNMNSIPFPSSSNIQRSPVHIPSFFPVKPDFTKQKSVEILLFPRRKDMATFDFPNVFGPRKRDSVTKPAIQIVGDKDLSSLKQPSASVKKDLTLLEKNNNQDQESVDALQTDSPPVTTVNNAL